MTKRKSKSTSNPRSRQPPQKTSVTQIVHRPCDRHASPDRPWLRRAAEAAGRQVRRCQAGPRNQGRRPDGVQGLQASPPDVAESPRNCRGSALRQRPRVCAEHSASPVQRPRCGAWRSNPQAALSPENDKDSLPAARGLPRSWDEIAPGHLVIAQESLDYGWWEAIVLDRKGDDFHPAVPRLPAPAQVRPASQRHCADEPAHRRSRACGSRRAGLTSLGPQSRTQPFLPPKNLEVRHGQQDCAHPRAER